MHQIISMITQSPSTLFGTRLANFNTLAVQYQDEAYTFAYYLVGDDASATKVTQTAFAQLYHHPGWRPDNFRLEALRWVLAACRSIKGSAKKSRGPASHMQDALCRQLLSLADDERSAIVLVDVLGLEYEEAAYVLGCSKKQVARWLTFARVSIHQ